MVDDYSDAARIIQELKQEVRARSEYLRSGKAVSIALAHARLRKRVNPHQPIAWPHWPRGLGPKVVAFIQKVVRRLLRWYINPIVEEQNQFNKAVIEVLEALAEENTQLRIELLKAHADVNMADDD